MACMDSLIIEVVGAICGPDHLASRPLRIRPFNGFSAIYLANGNVKVYVCGLHVSHRQSLWFFIFQQEANQE